MWVQANEQRPRSAVTTGVGIAGLIGLASWVLVARYFQLDGPYAGLVAVLACGLPMVWWSLAIDRVHRHASTGLDWSGPPRPLRDTVDITLVKLTGLWATWGLIAAAYCIGRWYWDGGYLFAMHVLQVAALLLLVLSVPYVLWIDRRLVEPRDGAFAFGQFLIGQGDVDRPALIEHFRSWTVKGFFLAFMISIVPGNFREVIQPLATDIVSGPVALARWLIALMFLVDVAFATVGYVLTLRPLDAHIRSANPFVAGWAAALICYPPFILMSSGGPLDYHYGTREWSYWLDGQPLLLAVTGAVLVVLTGIYAWATVAFGLRFSNLTHRGILTHGPYRWSKHPAYLSKNAFWWIATTPLVTTTGSLVDIVRNTVTLALVSGVYYWRARTEEKHLGADPAYRAYAEWMERNAPIPRFLRRIRGGSAAAPLPAE
ncbi:MAG: isoprenylcysteine carboxyl methyltransferase family protein [Sphingomonas bacterium]|nr:isoprenylcysteine carboxyl methyltransferase family protein [Sphingomonas bacterium]